MNKCKKCGHEWTGKIAEPKACPKCKRYDWNNDIHSTNEGGK